MIDKVEAYKIAVQDALNARRNHQPLIERDSLREAARLEQEIRQQTRQASEEEEEPVVPVVPVPPTSDEG